MKPILRNLLLAASTTTFIFFTTNAHAQLETDASATPEELAASLVGEGVTISGVTMDCPNGASGFFDCVDCNVGIANGILLTSGDVDLANGPNNSGSAGVGYGAPGDADLNDIPGVLGTNDACVLEFDITVTSDTVRFNYVFASEEYIEYVNLINDVFAFYISGPGIAGTENMALIPGTATAVSINNVNHLVNTEYFVGNGTGGDAPYNTDDFYLQYDGFTTVLEAKRSVTPCETYHLKIAIADDADDVFDSGVFIEAGSLSSPGVNLTYETEIDGYPYLIEGCNEGTLTFELSFAPVDTFEVNIFTEGTALLGPDFTMTTAITFYPGDTLIIIPIIPIEDGLDEGVETIIITLDAGCITGIDESLTLYVYDAIPLTISSDTLICPGTEATLVAGGADTYSWSPETGLSDPNAAVTQANPTEPTVYTVTGTLASCVNTAETFVDIQGPTADAGLDTTIILGETAFLEASGGVEYTWTPAATLSDANIYNPTASPDFTTVYTVTVTTAIGCEFIDEVTVFVSNDAIVGVPNTFSPNGDANNEGFTIVVRGQLATYNLQIFNRWGQQVFESNNFENSWNGEFEGEEQPIGSYVYYLSYKDLNGQSFTQQGNLTLVR